MREDRFELDQPEGIDSLTLDVCCDLPAVPDDAGIHTEYPCDPSRCKRGGKRKVSYLVIHYVGASGSAKDNAKYFHTPRKPREAPSSAHYFVGHADEQAAVYRSVAEEDIAWHCGTTGTYRHPYCRNENSIGVELCCHQRADGAWYFDPETVAAAQALCRALIKTHNIPHDHVLRHYDVTGKDCPRPFVQDRAAWPAFLAGLQ